MNLGFRYFFSVIACLTVFIFDEFGFFDIMGIIKINASYFVKLLIFGKNFVLFPVLTHYEI
uniref:Putative ovule protein n=1 Tax=Solanum chacoense TaxID=4108 RepID=A0A0V0GVJ5_SOLCH